MFLKPMLLLFRTRLIVVAVAAVLVAVLTLLMTSADSLSFDVLWHKACSCPPDPADTRVLLNSALMDGTLIAILLGIGAVFGQVGAAASMGGTRFFLTRPVTRTATLLGPFALAAVFAILMPIAANGLLLLWLWTVHAPSLNHLLRLMQLLPAVAALGEHPSFLAIAGAAHLLRLNVAGASLALDLSAIATSSQWFILSRNGWVKTLAFMQLPIVFLGFRFLPRVVLMLAPRGGNLTYMPSAFNIALHLLFAAGWLACSYNVLRDAEP